MKKLILLLITLVTFLNVSYASFPIEENSKTELIVLNKDLRGVDTFTVDQDDEEDEPSLIIYVLRGLLLAGLLFFLLRLFWKSLDHKSFNDPWYRAKFIKFFSGLILIFLWPLGLLYLLYLLYKEGRDSSNKWYKGLALVGIIVWLIGFALFLAFALTFGTGFSGG